MYSMNTVDGPANRSSKTKTDVIESGTLIKRSRVSLLGNSAPSEEGWVLIPARNMTMWIARTSITITCLWSG